MLTILLIMQCQLLHKHRWQLRPVCPAVGVVLDVVAVVVGAVVVGPLEAVVRQTEVIFGG
jgi:hypothetical protein